MEGELHSLKNSNTKKRVDINVLLNKVRSAQKKEKMESTIFFGLIAAVIVITGLIISVYEKKTILLILEIIALKFLILINLCLFSSVSNFHFEI